MARALRIEPPENRCPVTARTSERREIFRDDSDRSHVLELLMQLGDLAGEAGLCGGGAGVRPFGRRLENDPALRRQLRKI